RADAAPAGGARAAHPRRDARLLLCGKARGRARRARGPRGAKAQIPLLMSARDSPEERAKYSRIMQIGVRTMEFLRRLGAVEAVKNWGFPPDFPFDNVFLTSLTGYEIARFEMYALGSIRPNPFSPEHQWHCPKFVFDPILQRLAESFPSVSLRYGCRLESFEE